MTKERPFRKKIRLIFFLICYVVSLQAQDSLNCDSAKSHIVDNTHNIKLSGILIPAAVTGVTALFTDNNWVVARKHDVQAALSQKGKYKIPIDDYMQYTPMIAVYGLNLAGVKGQHSFKDRTIILAMSYLTMGILVNSMKYTIREPRPDSSSRNSFPSGHTATAFMGAEFLYQEYKEVSPFIAYAGYAVATATAYLRIYNDRHWVNDVIAGACIGILSTKLSYKLYPLIFHKSDCHRSSNVVALPYYNGRNLGLCMSLTF